MEKLIGYSCIIVGLIFILGVLFFSKQQIGWPIFKASICLAVPVLALWISFAFGVSLAEDIIFKWPYNTIFLVTLTVLTFIFNGFEMKHLLSFLVFLIGFMMIYFGLFWALIIGNMRIGF